MCDFCGHDIILRASKEEKVVEKFLKEEIKLLNEEWKSVSKEAIEKALKEYNKSKDSKKGIEKFLATLLLLLKSVVTNKNKLKEFDILTEGLYDYFKTQTAKKFKTKLIFEEIDKNLVKAYGKDGPYWINNYYNTFLSERISELSNKLLERGLSHEEIGIKLREMIEKELALRGGSNYKSLVPKRFAGNIEAYNQIIVTTAAQRIKAYSSIVALYNAGIEVFVYTATLDKRTCSRCVELHGSKFAVETAYNKVEAVANAESPEEFKAIMPWYNTLTEVKALTNNQVPIPPIHGRCRCTIEAE